MPLGAKNPRGITPIAFVIHTKTENVAVGHLQTAVVGFQSRHCFTVMLFIDQYRGRDTGGLCLFAVFENSGQCRAFIENIIDDDDVTPPPSAPPEKRAKIAHRRVTRCDNGWRVDSPLPMESLDVSTSGPW